MRAQWQKFVIEYTVDFNAKKAAIRAGYSERSAHTQGYRLLKNDEVANAIAERIKTLCMGKDEVLLRLAEQARGVESQYFHIGELLGSGVEVIDDITVDFAKLVRDGKGHLIKSLSYNKDGDLSRIEFYDAQAALALVGRHHKLFTDNVDLTSEGKPIDVVQVRVNEPEQPNP